MRKCAFFLTLLAASALMGASPSASDLYQQAQKAEKAGRIAEAYLLYSQAAALDPKKPEYWSRSQALRAEALAEGKIVTTPAPAVSPAATEERLQAALETPTFQELQEAREARPPAELQPSPIRKDFNLDANAEALFNTVAAAFGFECSFDRDYQATNPIRFRVTDVDYRDALHALEAATGSFIVPQSEKRFMVVKDTPAKRTELEPVATVSVQLPDAVNQQDFTAMLTAVQQAIGIERVAFDAANYTVVMKDRVSKVLPARMMLESLNRRRAEVAIEVLVMEVSRNDAITYGLDIQVQFPLFALTDWLGNKPSIPQGIAGLLTFGGGNSLMGLGIVNAALVAQMSKSSGGALLHSMVRSTSGQPVSFLVGDRYPIMTSGYFGAITDDEADVYRPPPTISYEDLGLTLKMTPLVHSSEEVTLDLDLAFKVLSGGSVDGIPIISNRSLKSVARVKTDDWVMVSGLLNSQEARMLSGIAGLSRLPVLGPLFGVRNRIKSDQNVLILLRPYLLAAPPGETKTHQFYLGSETRPVTPL